MFILVLGREKSGKSRYAESLSVKLGGGNPVYVATMIPVGDGEAGTARIARHRRQREGLRFETVEQPCGLSRLELEPGRTALLEDVSNLLANMIFGGSGGIDEAVTDITALAGKCDNLIAVSLTGVVESDRYDEATNRYIAALREVNAKLGELADAVAEVENGEPIMIKGEFIVSRFP